MWIRYGAVGFVAAVARTLNVADVHCNLLPLLQPFLKHPVVQVDQEVWQDHFYGNDLEGVRCRVSVLSSSSLLCGRPVSSINK